MLSVDADADVTHAPEYLDIILPYQLSINSESEELFVGQQFVNNEDCVFVIKRYNMKVSMDYEIVKSTPKLYVGECWRFANGCN